MVKVLMLASDVVVDQEVDHDELMLMIDQVVDLVVDRPRDRDHRHQAHREFEVRETILAAMLEDKSAAPITKNFIFSYSYDYVT